MSHDWSLRCMKCGDYAGRINNGEDMWRKAIKCWPEIKPLTQAMKDHEDWPWEIEVRINIVGDQETNICEQSVWQFLLEHERHGIEMASEYGDDHYPPETLIPAAWKGLEAERVDVLGDGEVHSMVPPWQGLEAVLVSGSAAVAAKNIKPSLTEKHIRPLGLDPGDGWPDDDLIAHGIKPILPDDKG